MLTLYLLLFIMGFSFCLGLNPYLTLLTTVVLIKHVPSAVLPVEMNSLQHDILIAMLAMLALIHFIVDMTPGIDSAGDIANTTIRIPLASIIPVMLLEHSHHAWQLAGFAVGLLFGTTAHFAKASLRAYINGHLHPALNWLAALAEMLIIVVLMAVITHHLWIGVALTMVLWFAAFGLIIRFWRDFHHLTLYILQWLRKRKGWREADSFFD